MADHVLVVESNATAGNEDAYNDWYDNVHLGEIIALPGFVSAQRFQPAQPAGDGPTRYLAIYGIDGDPQVAMGALGKAAQSGELDMSGPIERETIKMTVYKARTGQLT